MTLDLLTERKAAFSPCRRWRYSLIIRWGGGPHMAWCMLNPSTADEFANDPTVERCERRARMWGYGGMEVVNLFAWRSTEPENLADAVGEPGGPIGVDNDAHIIGAVKAATMVVCGWGNSSPYGRERGPAVLALIRAAGKVPHALKLNGDGSPVHPLYQPYAAVPFPMEAMT
jgi:hypothetical protein